jgi:hypothetical protein
MRHLLWMVTAVAFVLLCTLLPFLPGSYDSFAVTVFLMAQHLAAASLLLVPVGIGWLVHQVIRSRAGASSPDKSHVFAFAALAVAALVGAFLALTVAFSSGASLGIVAVAVYAFLLWQGWQRVSARAYPAALPVYLIVVAPAAASLQWLVADRATEFSRNRAIANSALLIAELERYKESTGRYPVSLLGLHPDYKPLVRGIPQYHYEPNREYYNIYFEQPSFIWGTREIVMYNPRDEQLMFSHAADRVTYPPRPLAGGGGFYAVKAASRPHWKYFLFD